MVHLALLGRFLRGHVFLAAVACSNGFDNISLVYLKFGKVLVIETIHGIKG